ncbi:hypothetical protein BSZ35_16070 [Salinibacter sp. 10B]|nr:hypothetical protein BSZ35_16070 [Salinibacter sp. 10B]
MSLSKRNSRAIFRTGMGPFLHSAAPPLDFPLYQLRELYSGKKQASVAPLESHGASGALLNGADDMRGVYLLPDGITQWTVIPRRIVERAR